MTRVKRGTTTNKRHKKILKLAKGYRSGRSRVFKLAKQAVMKAGMNAYRDRRRKKRDFRRLWNARISAALKPYGINYSRFINALVNKQIVVNRKMLSEISLQYPEAFGNLVGDVKK